MGKPLDKCARQVKARVAVWPSARASQMVAKCRKKHGIVRKTQAGRNLKRWTKEKWVDTSTGKACGNKSNDHEYCRPSKKISKKTPVMKPKLLAANQSRKRAGLRAQSVPRK